MTKQEAATQLRRWFEAYDAVVNGPGRATFDEKQFTLLSHMGLQEQRLARGASPSEEYLSIAAAVESTQLCKILLARFGDTRFYPVPFAKLLIYFVALASDRPATAIMLMNFLYLKHLLANGDTAPRTINIYEFAGLCAEGLPSEKDAHSLWDLQKAQETNLLDNISLFADAEFIQLFRSCEVKHDAH